MSPKIEGSKILPTGAVLSFVIAVLFYTAWYYSDRKDDVQTASNVIIEANETKEIVKNGLNKKPKRNDCKSSSDYMKALIKF